MGNSKKQHAKADGRSVPAGREGWHMGGAGLTPEEGRREEEALFAVRRLSLEPRCDFLHHDMGIRSLTY